MSTLPAENPCRGWKLSALLARIVVGGLFLISGYGKIVAPQDFVREIREYELAPVVTTNSLAYILPWVELLAGLLLITTVWRREARLIIAALLVVFTIAKVHALATGKDPSCGCGGDIQILQLIYDLPQGIVTNLVLLALLGVDRRAQRLTRKPQGYPRPGSEPLPADVPDST